MNPMTTLSEDIVAVGRRLDEKQFIAANDGNISAKSMAGHIIITPTGVSKGKLEPAALAEIDDTGQSLNNVRPTSEYRMHLAIYRQRPDVAAVVHAHSPYATACGLLGWDMRDAVLPEVVVSIGRIPILPYRPPSTQALADQVGEAIRISEVVLLERHGIVSVGSSLMQAYERLERAEHAFHIWYLVRSAGQITTMTQSQAAELDELFRTPDRLPRI